MNPHSDTSPKPLYVVAAVIPHLQGKILIARRPLYLEQGGLWEFPGGKREAGELPEQTLARELKEELDITVQQARPFIRISHDYGTYQVLLDVWYVEQWDGNPQGREGQTLAGCERNDLLKKDFPTANYPIITATRLPVYYLITPEPTSAQDKKFFYRLERKLDAGISLVQLRAKHLSERDYCYCAERTLTLCDRYAAQLLVNATATIALSVGTAGVHLTSSRLLEQTQRPLPAHLWVAASCHTESEIQYANQIGVDFIVVSPVKHTATHPKTKPLGWNIFWQLTERAHCPVYALGGMKISDMACAWAHGAQGIAAIRALWD